MATAHPSSTSDVTGVQAVAVGHRRDHRALERVGAVQQQRGEPAQHERHHHARSDPHEVNGRRAVVANGRRRTPPVPANPSCRVSRRHAQTHCRRAPPECHHPRRPGALGGTCTGKGPRWTIDSITPRRALPPVPPPGRQSATATLDAGGDSTSWFDPLDPMNDSTVHPALRLGPLDDGTAAKAARDLIRESGRQPVLDQALLEALDAAAKAAAARRAVTLARPRRRRPRPPPSSRRRRRRPPSSPRPAAAVRRRPRRVARWVPPPVRPGTRARRARARRPRRVRPARRPGGDRSARRAGRRSGPTTPARSPP